MPAVEAKAAVKGLLKGLGEVKTAVQRSAVQRGSFKGTEITMAGHIPGGVTLHRAELGIKVDLKPPRPWKVEQVWVVGGGKKSWRVKEDSL